MVVLPITAEYVVPGITELYAGSVMYVQRFHAQVDSVVFVEDDVLVAPDFFL